VRTLGKSSSIRILVVGHADAESTRICEALDADAKSTIRTLLEYADSDTEEAAFASADAVWVAYKDHALMSGVFCQALSAGIPVIAPDYGLIEWLALRQGVGISVNTDDIVSTGLELSRLFSDADSYTRLCRNAVQIGLTHAPAQFGASVCDAISSSVN
jgi:glycosyltransferase involved in cell wall biosynthesis